jgi:hypothetical protein
MRRPAQQRLVRGLDLEEARHRPLAGIRVMALGEGAVGALDLFLGRTAT